MANANTKQPLNAYDQALKDEGFEELEQDPTTSQITFWGSADSVNSGSDKIAVGDPVEVYASDGKAGGKWQSGLVALSPVTQGASDGDYPGEPVIWVGWVHDHKHTPQGQLPPGDEWPADGVRKAGGKDA